MALSCDTSFPCIFSQKFHFCHYFFSKNFLSICSRNLDCVMRELCVIPLLWVSLSISYKRNLRWKLFTAAAADENENPGNESKELKSKSTVACDCVKLDTIRQTKAWLNLKNNTPIPFWWESYGSPQSNWKTHCSNGCDIWGVSPIAWKP